MTDVQMPGPTLDRFGRPLPLIPLEDRLLLTLEPTPTQTASGLHLPPDMRTNGARTGHVLAVGPGHVNDAGVLRPVDDVAVGDTVIIGGYGGTEVTVDNVEYVLIPRREVLAVVTP
jgi:chaperonin GroES